MQEAGWVQLLICPICNSGKPEDVSALRCATCGNLFARKGNTWWFLEGGSSDRNRLETSDGKVMVAGYRTPSRWLKVFRKVITSEFFPGKSWRIAKKKVLEGGGNTLVIGSGVTHYANAIHLDLDDFPGVDVVADAHALPFQSESLDAVVCEVVLEHAHHPQQILLETERVLKPGGEIFFVVPFVFPFHGHPADYRRWSRQGLEKDFCFLEKLEVGIMGGPCSSMVNLLSEWAYVMTGMRFPKGYTLVKGGVTAMLSPLKFFDLFVNKFPEAHRLASTLYVYGRKPENNT